MSSKLITKIANRPNFYFFDTALKDGKKLTVKFCLFTKNLDEAARLANSIKAAANETLAKKITTTHANSKSLRALINIKRQNEQCIKQNGLFLDVSEYKELSKEVIAKFYNLVAPEEKLEKELKTLLDVSLSPKEATPISFETVAKRYVQTECLKLKSSDKTKGYYVKTGKLLDEFLKIIRVKSLATAILKTFKQL
ncbi:hypothetical protein VB002_10735 [Campylobacter concisus]